MTLFIGIDGGGTKTHALVLDTVTMQTTVIEGNASRTSSVGWETSFGVVKSLIDEGLSRLKANPNDILGISACMSGIDLPDQSRRMKEELVTYYPSASVEVVNDSLAALSAGTQRKSGIVLVGGTGSIAVGEDDQGNIVRAGGYGSLIGDEGSGYDIGRQGLMAAVQYFEERGPQTILWDKVMKEYGVNHPNQLISIVYEATYPIGVIAAFAPIVIDCAETDACAKAILDDAIASYGGLIRSINRKLHGRAGDQVVLAGGIFTNSGFVLSCLRETCPTMKFDILHNRPVVGALFRSISLQTGRDRDALLAQVLTITETDDTLSFVREREDAG